MRKSAIAVVLLAGCLSGAGLAAPVDQTRLNNAAADQGDWLTYGRTYSEQRYSPLTQINRATVSKLGLEWSAQFDTHRGQEATPLVADGVLYTTTAWSKVFAFDAKTGKQLWSYDPKVPGGSALSACCDVVNRGAALWKGKVYVGTVDGRLIGLDAKTGKEVWSAQTSDPKLPYTITGAPRVVKGKVLIGNGGAEYGVRGYLSAYDAETGKLSWRFYVTPNPDGQPDGAASDKVLAEKAAATWFGDVWKKSGGGGTPWDAITYDPQTDLVYIGTGNGSPWNHHIRSQGQGDNLFLSSIVAVRPDTGEYVWHYQTTPGDSWDYTAVQQIMVADLTIKGVKRHVVMQAPKNGFFYVLDAKTGELLSAEKYAPFADWAYGVDMKTGRPVERPGIRWGAGGTTIQKPGAAGAHSWKPMAFNPKEGLVYIPVFDSAGYFSVVNPNDFRITPGSWNLGSGVQGIAPKGEEVSGAVERAANSTPIRPANYAKLMETRGFLTAWDPVERKARWSVESAGPDWGLGGVLATASGLVFQGVRHSLKAYDAANGKEVWSQDIGASAMAPPMTYAVGGIQYLAVMVGNGGGNGEGNSNRTDVPVPGRLLVFRVGGTAQIPPYNVVARTPVDLKKAEASTGDAAVGGVYFRRYCTYCHGANFIYPDLRKSPAILTKRSFKAIVHDGALQNAGMASFAKILDEDQVESIRGYLVKTYSETSP